eukprot:maker-scaffold474_size162001-snap-gene-0.27 protein:Tk10281 transcript:maker-scaffold474_size162001-snap-gene-0.27-mRNA-1 annotation:"arrestin domain-containing protein 3-like"
MFTMLSGIRLASGTSRPYFGSMSANYSGNPNANHAFHGHFRRPHPRSCGDNPSLLPAVGLRLPGLSGKIQVMKIILDKEIKPVFEPGQEVTGKLLLEVIGTLRFRSLSVSMRGMAKVHWTESKATGNRLGAYTEQYNAEIEYFNRKRYIIGGGPSQGDRHTLPEGRHEFPFRFQLPTSTDIATSFEGKYGSIRYCIKADLDQPWAFTHRTKRAFTVLSPIDINTEDFREPVEDASEKTICCWMCSGGEVQMRVATDRKGYCPGESVALDATFINSSSRRVVPEAVLCQTETFMAGGKIRTKSTKFTSLSGQVIQPRAESTWDAQLLKIPVVSPTISNCALIKVDYSIKISLAIAASYTLSVHLPIVVGTVPHRRVVPLHSFSNLTLSSDPSPPYPDPPPSYMECTQAAADLVDESDLTETASLHGDTRFVPMYCYVRDYQPLPPPEYSETDPFPLPRERIHRAEADEERDVEWSP